MIQNDLHRNGIFGKKRAIRLRVEWRSWSTTRRIIGLMLFVTLPSTATAQDIHSILAQALQAHVTGKPIQDVTAIGTITRSNGSPQAVTISAKGPYEVRMDFPAEKRSVFYSGQQGWTLDSNGNTLAIQANAAFHRPTIFPFLDLITEIENAELQLIDGGTQTMGGHTVRRIILTLPDKTPNMRAFRRPLDESLDLYIDTQSYLILRSIRYRTSEKNLSLKVPSVLDFSDYRLVNGAQVPFRIVNTIGNSTVGTTTSTLVLQMVNTNTGLTDSLFAPK